MPPPWQLMMMMRLSWLMLCTDFYVLEQIQGKGHKKRDEKRDVYRTQKSTVSRAIHVNNEIPPIRKVRHVSSKESNVTGVIFDSFSCHMAGDLIIFP